MAPSIAVKPAKPQNPAGNRPRPNLLAAAEALSVLLDCLGIPLSPALAVETEHSVSLPVVSTPQVGGKELAREITGLSYSRIYSLVAERAIPHSKRGNKLYFNRAELLAWVAEGKRVENKK